MFDTMTVVKTLGALCGALLIFLLGGWFAQTIYAEGGGHGHDGEHVQGYKIEVAGAEGAAEEDAGPTFEELLASADAGKGERVFKKCSACHSTEAGKNMTGPSLAGIVGRPVDSIADFSYSGALEQVVDAWTPENLDHFLTKPAGFAPGTTMGFAGLGKAEDRANVIAYLQSVGG